MGRHMTRMSRIADAVRYENPPRRYRNARNGDIGPGGAGCQRWVSLLYALGASVDTTRRRRR